MSKKKTSAAAHKERISRIFDGAAATYDHVGPRFFSHFGRRLVEVARIPSGSTVLDVATGRGAVLLPASAAVGEAGKVVGIDFSENMVKETSRDLSSLKTAANSEVIWMDAENLQFDDEMFDFVLCGFAIFFFPDLDQALAEFHRVLKPGGLLCVTTFAELFDDEWAWYYDIFDAHFPSQPDQPQEFEEESEPGPVFDTPEGLRAILTGGGFEDIQVRSETVEFVYQSAENFWASLWSHGARGGLERLEQAAGSEGLEGFRLEVFSKFKSIRQTDGLHQLVPVHLGLGSKPSSE